MSRFLALFLFVFMPLSLLAQDENEPKPDTVTIGAYIISIHDIDFHNKEYTTRFWLWTLHENNGKFDFPNQLDIPNAKDIEKPDVISDTLNNRVWQLLKMKSVMKQNWEVTDFPFDKQKLVIHVENSIYDRNSLVFVPDNLGSTYDREMTIDGWHISNFTVTKDVKEYTTVFGDPSSDMLHSEYASFNIQIDIERNAWGLFMKIFIGMYIAFMISVLSFTTQPSELEPRFGLPVGGLFAAVGNKYIIDSLLPESSTFTLVDSLHATTFLAIFTTLLVSAISLHYYDKGNTVRGNKISYWGSRIVVVSFVIINIIFILSAV